MRLWFSLMCLIIGTSICGCTRHGQYAKYNAGGIKEYGDEDFFEESINQAEAYEGKDYDGNDDEDQDVNQEEVYKGKDYDGNDDEDDDEDQDVVQEDTYEDKDYDGNEDEDQKKEDAMIADLDLLSNNIATTLRFRPAVTLCNGDIVHIQVVANMVLHVGCPSGRTCGAQTCPGLYFDPVDYRRCGGEVFQIYRAAGYGPVRTGENVGFYFPAKRQWLRADGGRQTDLISCPGIPRNSHHRLNTGCYGEVFQLFVRGKGYNQPIHVWDQVMIYFPRARAYLEYPHNHPRFDGLYRGTCPRAWRRLPPLRHAYERCRRYVFQIGKKR